jgi:hypothetical protein
LFVGELVAKLGGGKVDLQGAKAFFVVEGDEGLEGCFEGGDVGQVGFEFGGFAFGGDRNHHDNVLSGGKGEFGRLGFAEAAAVIALGGVGEEVADVVSGVGFVPKDIAFVGGGAPVGILLEKGLADFDESFAQGLEVAFAVGGFLGKLVEDAEEGGDVLPGEVEHDATDDESGSATNLVKAIA